MGQTCPRSAAAGHPQDLRRRNRDDAAQADDDGVGAGGRRSRAIPTRVFGIGVVSAFRAFSVSVVVRTFRSAVAGRPEGLHDTGVENGLGGPAFGRAVARAEKRGVQLDRHQLEEPPPCPRLAAARPPPRPEAAHLDLLEPCREQRAQLLHPVFLLVTLIPRAARSPLRRGQHQRAAWREDAAISRRCPSGSLRCSITSADVAASNVPAAMAVPRRPPGAARSSGTRAVCRRPARSRAW